MITHPMASATVRFRDEIQRTVDYLAAWVNNDEGIGKLPPEWVYQVLLKLHLALITFDQEARLPPRPPPAPPQKKEGRQEPPPLPPKPDKK